MLHGAAWAARPDRAFALVEDPQQLRLADWKDQRTRRRAELAEKTARREAEFTALIPAIAAQVAADVSAAVAAALQTTRVGHHEGLNHAPKTTSTPTTSVADDHDLNRAPAATPTTTRSVAANYDPTAISTHPAPASVLTACAVRDGNLATHPPTTCSTICPGRAAASAVSTITSAATSASATDVVPKRCCFDCEPAVVTSTPTSTLDISGDCSTVANSLTHDAISTTSPAKASVRASTSTHVPTAVPVDSTLASVPAELDAYAISDEALSVDDTSVSALPAAAMLILATPGRPPDQATLSGMFSGLPIAAGNTVLSLPWDPGAQNSSTTDELSALEHELPIVSRTVHGDTSQLLSSSIHGEYNDCLEVGKLQDLMVALTNLQPWPSWQPYFWGPTEMSSSWAKMIIEIANLGAVMSTKEPLQVLPLSTPCLRDFILLIFAECDALESEARVVLLEEPPQLHGSDIVGDTVVFPQLGDENTLVWYSKDREKQLSLNSVSTVILGQKTINFQRQRWPEKEHQSLSLIYRNGECSLDLICRDRNQAECWHLGLTAFISSPVSPISSVGSKSSRQMTSCTSTLRSYIQRKSYSSSFQHSIAMWSFCNLESCQGQLSWDPGIWALLCSFGLLTQAEVKGKRNDAAPTFCCDHYLDQYFFDKACDDQDAYFDVFRDQVHISHDYLGVFRQQVGAICYFNLVKVCLNYDTHLDLGEVRKPQVPWDPGGSTRHRLEVKPKFKEGGMLATSPTISTGLGLGCYYWLGLLGIRGSSDYIYGRKRLEQAAGNGRLRPPLLLFLFSFLL